MPSLGTTTYTSTHTVIERVASTSICCQKAGSPITIGTGEIVHSVSTALWFLSTNPRDNVRHGMQDWRYDEENFHLGLPHGNATVVPVVPAPGPPPPPPPPPRSYPTGKEAWHLWTAPSNTATHEIDTVDVPYVGCNASDRIEVQTADGMASDIDLGHGDIVLQSAQAYTLKFWAKVNQSGVTLTVNARINGDPWTTLGLQVSVCSAPRHQKG